MSANRVETISIRSGGCVFVDGRPTPYSLVRSVDGVCDFYRTKDAFFGTHFGRIALRKKVYESDDELHADILEAIAGDGFFNSIATHSVMRLVALVVSGGLDGGSPWMMAFDENTDPLPVEIETHDAIGCAGYLNLGHVFYIYGEFLIEQRMTGGGRLKCRYILRDILYKAKTLDGLLEESKQLQQDRVKALGRNHV